MPDGRGHIARNLQSELVRRGEIELHASIDNRAPQAAIRRKRRAELNDRPPTVADPEVLQALESPDPSIRRAAAETLAAADRRPPGAATALARALTDENRWVRDRAARALAAMGPEAAPAVEALVKALDDPDGYVRWRAAKALGAVGAAARAALPALDAMAAAEDEPEPGRSWAREAAARIRGD